MEQQIDLWLEICALVVGRTDGASQLDEGGAKVTRAFAVTEGIIYSSEGFVHLQQGLFKFDQCGDLT